MRWTKTQEAVDLNPIRKAMLKDELPGLRVRAVRAIAEVQNRPERSATLRLWPKPHDDFLDFVTEADKLLDQICAWQPRELDWSVSEGV